MMKFLDQIVSKITFNQLYFSSMLEITAVQRFTNGYRLEIYL